MHGQACLKTPQHPTCSHTKEGTKPAGKIYVIDLKPIMGADWRVSLPLPRKTWAQLPCVCMHTALLLLASSLKFACCWRCDVKTVDASATHVQDLQGTCAILKSSGCQWIARAAAHCAHTHLNTSVKKDKCLKLLQHCGEENKETQSRPNWTYTCAMYNSALQLI